MNQTIKLSLLTTLLLNSNLFAEEKLEDITVTSATKTSQKLSDVTSNMNVITAQEIEERHYTTVTEALNSLPGISFRSNGGVGKQTSVNLRGMDSKKILVLIDGIRYNDITGLSGAPFSHLMATNIERIEVLKGAQSGIWGADASAGVINIITKEAQQGLQFSALQEFGSFNTTQSNINASYKNNNFYIKANHNNINTKSFTSYAPNGTAINLYEDDAYSNKTTNLKVGFNITATNKIDISHTIIDTKNDLDDFTGQSTTAKNTSNNKFSSINLNHIDSFNTVNLYAKKSTFQRFSVTSQGSTPFDGEVNEYGLTSQIPYLNDSFLLLGGDYKKFEHKNSISKSYTNKALFITNHNKIKNPLGNTVITESLRNDKYSAFNNKTTGKIGLKHTFNLDGLTTSANYGTAYNVPTLYNLYEPASNFGPIGNENLQPEKIKSYDLTVTYKDFSATYYNQKIDNLTQFVFGTGYSNVNGTSKIKGYELAYNTTLFDTLALSLGYDKLSAKDKDGQNLFNRVKESLKFGIDYYGIKNLHLGLNGEYIGDRKAQKFNANFTTSEVSTGNYTMANFVANYEWDKHLSFYGKIDNITDKYYQTTYNYATSPRAAYVGMKLTY